VTVAKTAVVFPVGNPQALRVKALKRGMRTWIIEI
jgi:hypothetical protein